MVSPSKVLIKTIAFTLSLLYVSSNAEKLGKICADNSDCAEGSSCVAGAADFPIQRCVAGSPCTGSSEGKCPADETNGQLACIWRPSEAGQCTGSKISGCKEIGGTYGIYKCVSVARCDTFYGKGACSGSCDLDGKQCNGRGSCLLTGIDDSGKPTFGCQCATGWSGDLCDTVVNDECVLSAGECGSHGTCKANKCVCEEGFSGDQCELSDGSAGSNSTTSANGSQDGGSKPKLPVSSSTSRNNQGTDEETGDSAGGGGSPATVIILVLCALIVVVLLAVYAMASRKKHDTNTNSEGDFTRQDSEIAGGDTPKGNIVIM